MLCVLACFRSISGKSLATLSGGSRNGRESQGRFWKANAEALVRNSESLQWWNVIKFKGWGIHVNRVMQVIRS